MEKNGVSLTKKNSPESSSFDNTWIYSKLKVFKARLIWKISDFGFVCQRCSSVYLYSDTFSSAAVDDKIKWSLQLHSDSESKGIEMRLNLENYQQRVNAHCRLIIYDKTMNEAYAVNKSHCFNKNSAYISEKMCLPDDIVSADKKILSNDELTVGCEIKFVNDFVSTTGADCSPKFMHSNCRLDNLKIMYKSQDLSDVKVNVGLRTFDAHKAILAAASPVFLAMFKSSMTECEENSINIDDMDVETFEEMLSFIYTGNVNNIENVAETLFAAADKYSMDNLKHICQTQLCRTLTVDNAVRVLILADLHNSDWLKAQVINFTKLDPVGVTKTEDFNSMIDSHRHLLTEILCALTIK